MSRRFFAYPSSPPAIGSTVSGALEILKNDFNNTSYKSWEENDIAGRFLVDPILSEIDEGDLYAFYFEIARC